FALPLVHWMRTDLKEHLLGILLEPRSLQRGYFNADAVRTLVHEHMRGVRDRSGVLWQLLVFELWHRNFLEQQFGPVSARPWESTSTESVRMPMPIGASAGAEAAVSRSSLSNADDGKIRVAIVAPSLRKVGGQAVQASLLMQNWKNDPAVGA